MRAHVWKSLGRYDEFRALFPADHYERCVNEVSVLCERERESTFVRVHCVCPYHVVWCGVVLWCWGV